MPEVLYEAVIEVEERVVLHQDECQLNLSSTIQGTTGEEVHKCTMTCHTYVYNQTRHLHLIMQ